MWKSPIAILTVLLLLGPANARDGPATGPLRICKENPRYFTDSSGKAIYLTGSHQGGEFQDDAWGGYSAGTRVTFDFAKYLDLLTAHHHNLIRFWQVETTRWDIGPPAMLTTPMPFLRTGPGKALDGQPKFDLTRFNPAYFDRLRSRVVAARDHGIYVMIMLFEGFSCVHTVGPGYANPPATNPWFGHPYNGKNNVNGIDADADGDGRGIEFHCLAAPAVTALQKAYVRKVIDTVNDLDNVLYEIANESVPQSKDWQYEMINTVKRYEGTKAKQHPVVMSAYWPAPTNPALFASPADAVAPSGVSGSEDYENNPPPATGKKVVICDSDHVNWHTKDRRYVWKNFLRGNNVLVFDEKLVAFDWSRGVVVLDDRSREPIRRAMGHTRTYADRMDLAGMTPHGGLSSTDYCLANAGSEYLVYQPKSGPFSITLTAGKYAYEWFNPSTGKVAGTGSLTAPDGSQPFTPPIAGDAVLYLQRQ